ncbi:hypothetical protein ATKI12_4119 [Kitasatospora sp. Ki12]
MRFAYAISLTVLPSSLWRVLSVDLRIPLMPRPTAARRRTGSAASGGTSSG